MTSELKVVAKFNEWIKALYQLNALPVPDYALEIIRAQIHKRYGALTDMNESKIARVLRDINFEEFYNKEPEILQALEMKAVPEISPKCKERIKQLLIDMQPAYQKHTRTSRISFNYVMYKICQQFELKDLLDCIKLELSHEKLYKYDRIWHLICTDMKWYFIKSDPTICITTPQASPLLMGLGLNVNIQLDRDLEPWTPEELLKLTKGIEKKLTHEQIAVGHNRSLKNIENKLKEQVIIYHETNSHNIENIKLLTGLSEEVIIDAISRHEMRKGRTIKKSIIQERSPVDPKEATKNSDMKMILDVLKDIQTMMRYLVNKHG